MSHETDAFIGGFICGTGFFAILFVIRKYVWCLRSNRVADAPKEFSTENEYVLTLVVRLDIPLAKSKLAGHCAHASIQAFDSLLTKNPQAARFWMSSGQTKMLLAAESIDKIIILDDLARRSDLTSTFVCDERRSLIGPTTVTVLGIGPGPQNVLNRLTHDLRIM